MNKIILGSAQFGSDYGISNSTGKVDESEVIKILKKAHENDILFIDTAINYGDSEYVLGNVNKLTFEYITKIPKIPCKIKNIKDWILDRILESKEKLKCKSFYGILLHFPDQLNDKIGLEISRTLHYLKKKKICKKIGVSIYDFSKIQFYYKILKFDLIQLPFNVIDNRVLKKNILKFLKEKKVEIHARSIFLQGLLLDKKNLNKVENSYKFLNEWFNWLDKNNFSPISTCLNYVSKYKEIDKIIIGVQSNIELQEILDSLHFRKNIVFPKWKSKISKTLIDPSKWKK